MPTFDEPLTRFWWITDSKDTGLSSMPRDFNGYLADEAITSPAIKSLADLENVECAILLGEAGFGKSEEVKREVERLRSLTNPPRVLFVDLFEISERENWANDVLEHDEIQNWLVSKDGSVLHLWFDGLDETPWRTQSLLKALFTALEKTWKSALFRLRLRILSRPLAWDDNSIQRLQKIWSEQETERQSATPKSYVWRCELCPLRAADVRDFALASRLDADDFWGQIHRLKAHTFAWRPRTLVLLASKFKRGELRSQKEITRADLFEFCILTSCGPTPGRSRKKFKEQLLPEQKMRIAERLAAFSLLCSRPSLCTSASMEARTAAHELRFGETIPREWSDESHAFWHDERSREALDTPLFTSQTHTESDTSSREVHHFVERTDAEYLTARFLAEHPIENAQILSLLCHSVSDVPGQDAPRVVPQLAQVAAWLANLRPSLRPELFRRDPRALLESDLSVWNADAIGALLRSLFNEIESEKFFNRDFKLSNANFDNPHLADQLSPTIFNPRLSVFTRRAAIDIAERSTHAQVLAPRLASLALEEGEDFNIRIEAAHAVGKMPDESAKAQLKSLALSPPDEDQSNEIQGAALRAVWPHHLSTREMFSVLKPPKDDLFGAYRGFLIALPARLRDEDLPVALTWCAKQRHSLYHRGESYSFDWSSLLHGIFTRAVALLANEKSDPKLKKQVTRHLAAAFATRYRCHDLTRVWDFSGRVTGNQKELHKAFGELGDEARRALAEGICRRLRRIGSFRHLLLSSGPRWFHERDFAWMLEQLRAETHPQGAKAWVELAEIAFQSETINRDPEMVALTQAVLADSSIPHLGELRQVFGMWFDGLEIASPRAENLKTQHKSWATFEREQKERDEQRTREQTEQQRQIALALQTNLQACESGEVLNWWRIDFALVHDIQGSEYRGELNTHLNNSRTWKAANAGLRERLLAAAVAYLESYSPTKFENLPSNWQTTSSLYHVLGAAHRALLLLYLEDRARFDALPDAVLEGWAPAVVWFPWQGGEAWQADNQNLLEAVTARAPIAIAEAVEVHVERDVQKDGYVFVLRKVGFKWPPAFSQKMLEFAQNPKISPVALHNILSELLERESFPFFLIEQDYPVAAKALFEASESQTPAHRLALQLFESAFNFGNGRVRRTMAANSRKRKKLQRADANYTQRGERAAEIALAMMRGAFDGGWPLVWKALQEDPEWGEQVMLDYTERFDVRGKAMWVRFLDEKSLADWFLWLHALFPSQEDVHVMGAHFVSTREQLSSMRDELLRQLQNRGTPLSVQELYRIKAELPGHWAKYIIPDAEQNALERSWQPPSPSDLSRLLQNGKYRFVTSGDEMLEVVVESLARAEKKLTGHTPLAFVLWDKIREEKTDGSAGRTRIKEFWQPKGEERLSDWLAAHLRDDLRERDLIINREVVIRPSIADARGQRTDIHVDFNPKSARNDAPEPLRLIIEVKGQWNAKVETAMKEQLCEDYLAEESCGYGLYVVGWFGERDWHHDRKHDSRRRKIPALPNIHEAKKYFNEQAKTLCVPGVSVRAFVLDAALTHSSQHSTSAKAPAKPNTSKVSRSKV